MSTATGRAINIYSTNIETTISGGTVQATGDNGYAIYARTTNNSITVSGGKVLATGDNSHAITTGGSVHVSGTAQVSATSGCAIYTYNDSNRVTATNGSVRATTGYAVYMDGDSILEVRGGVVFAYGSSTSDVISASNRYSGASGTGVVLAWDEGASAAGSPACNYAPYATGHISADPGTATAYWFADGGAYGIYYADSTSTNTGFISLPVTVGTALTENDLSYDIPTDNTYNGAAQGIGTVTVTDQQFDGALAVYYTGTGDTSYEKSETAPANAGTYTVSVEVSGSSVYADLTGDNAISLGTYTIGKMAVTITPDSSQSKFYGALDPILTYTDDSGSALSFTGALSRAPGENVGTYAIALGDLSAGSNYALALDSGSVHFVIHQATVQSIDSTVNNVVVTAYELRDATTPEAVVAAANLPAMVTVSTDGGTASMPITWATATAYNAKGTIYQVTGSLTGSANIADDGITKAITITVNAVNAANPVFTDTLAVQGADAAASASDLGSAVLPVNGSITVSGSNVSYTIDWDGGETLDLTNAGNNQVFTGTITYPDPPAWLTLPVNNTVSRKVTVTEKQQAMVSVPGIASKTYSGVEYAPGEVNISDSRVNSSDLVWTWTSTDGGSYNSATPPTDAGDYRVTIAVRSDHATCFGSADYTFTIRKAVLTITSDDKTASVGDPLPAVTISYSGFVGNDDESNAFNTIPVAGHSVPDTSTPGTYNIEFVTMAVLAKDNYSVNHVTGTLTVDTLLSACDVLSVIAPSGATINGLNISATVSNGISTVAVNVTVSLKAAWTLYSDAACATPINGAWALSVGTNTAYIKVIAEDGTQKVYTLTVTRQGDSGGIQPGGPIGGIPSTEDLGKITVSTPKTDMPVPVTMTLTRTPGVSGTLFVTITETMMRQMITRGEREITSRNKTDDGYTLIYSATIASGYSATSLTIRLDTKALALLMDANVQRLEINSGLVSFGFDREAIDQLITQTDGNVSITARPVTQLSAAARAIIGDRPAWDISITSMKDGNAVTVNDFDNGAYTLKLGYTPANGEQTGNLYAIYVDGSGKPQVLLSSSYTDGNIITSRNTTSIYGVGYKAPGKAFTDTTDHWAKDDIDFVVSCGLFSGTSETAFSPNATITRGMFVTALGRLSGQDVSGFISSSFTDVTAGSYYLPYIEWATQNGIVQGTGGSQFAPDKAITREEMALMMFNYAKITDYTLPVSRKAAKFSDASGISSWAKDAITALNQAGILNGRTATTIVPKGSATRAEASAMLRRFVELVIDESTARGWTQLDNGTWQYYSWQGKPLTGWKTIEGHRYYFDQNGSCKPDKRPLAKRLTIFCRKMA